MNFTRALPRLLTASNMPTLHLARPLLTQRSLRLSKSPNMSPRRLCSAGRRVYPSTSSPLAPASSPQLSAEQVDAIIQAAMENSAASRIYPGSNPLAPTGPPQLSEEQMDAIIQAAMEKATEQLRKYFRLAMEEFRQSPGQKNGGDGKAKPMSEEAWTDLKEATYALVFIIFTFPFWTWLATADTYDWVSEGDDNVDGPDIQNDGESELEGERKKRRYEFDDRKMMDFLACP